MTSAINHDAAVLTGLILAGGKSSRMKQAKAHLMIHDVPQWQFAERAISPLCDAVYFSVSPQLSPPIPVVRTRLIDDAFREPIGPLGGIIAGFHRFPEHALFVLACDLPHFDAQAATYLMAARNPECLATVFVSDDGLEPLCAIYEPGIKGELARAWAENRYCPRAILNRLAVNKVIAPSSLWLTNLNHEHELESLVSQGRQRVTVHYYASLRERAGLSCETVHTAERTVGGLFNEMAAKHGFVLDTKALRFAQNDVLVDHDAVLKEQDLIVFIPPVSGG